MMRRGALAARVVRKAAFHALQCFHRDVPIGPSSFEILDV
jgi:hypothetical protein